ARNRALSTSTRSPEAGTGRRSAGRHGVMRLDVGLSARDKRTLIVGTVTIGTLFTLARGLPALLSWQRDRVADAETMAQQATSARKSVHALPELRDSLRVRSARLAALDAVMLSGVSSSAAAASLAAALGDIADAAPIKVAAMQLRADSAAPGTIAQVGVRVTGVTDVA